MAAEGSIWLRHFRHLLCNCWTEFHQTLQEASTQGPLPSLCFSCRSVNKYGCRRLWLADAFDIFSATTAQNFTKPYRKQVLKVLYLVCVFRADPFTNMAAEGSDLLTHFHYLLWNRCTFSTSSQRPLHRISRNHTESKYSRSSTKFVFLVLIDQQIWLPSALICWHIFDISSASSAKKFYETLQDATSSTQCPLPIFISQKILLSRALICSNIFATSSLRHYLV